MHAVHSMPKYFCDSKTHAVPVSNVTTMGLLGSMSSSLEVLPTGLMDPYKYSTTDVMQK